MYSALSKRIRDNHLIGPIEHVNKKYNNFIEYFGQTDSGMPVTYVVILFERANNENSYVYLLNWSWVVIKRIENTITMGQCFLYLSHPTRNTISIINLVNWPFLPVGAAATLPTFFLSSNTKGLRHHRSSSDIC